MLSHQAVDFSYIFINEMIQPFFKKIKLAISISGYLKNLIGADLVDSENVDSKNIDEMASNDSRGYAIIDYGSTLFTKHMCLFKPKQYTLETKEQFKTIVSLTEEDSRRPYHIISFFTASNFFLGMPDHQANPFRKEISKRLKPALYSAVIEKTVAEFLNSVHDELVLAYQENHQLTSAQLIKKIKYNIYATLLHVLLDTPLDADYEPLIEMVEGQFLNKHLIFYIFYPRLSLFLDPYLFALKDEKDILIKKFILAQLASASNQVNQKHGFFIKMMLKVAQKSRLSDLDENDTNLILNDKNIRLYVCGIFAIKNIVDLIIKSMQEITVMKNGHVPLFQEKIYNEIENSLHLTTQPKIFLDKKSFLNLHAFYLEALRFYPPMPELTRYTSKAISIGDINIPANTFIRWNMQDLLVSQNGEVPGSVFYPYRYIAYHQEENLNVLAKEAETAHLPFSIERRSCPAIKVSEVVFKTYVGRFFHHVHKIHLAQQLNQVDTMEKESSKKYLS